MNDLISIVVPVYNIEKYIERCIKSILSQTYSNIEIIIVDDSSTDNTASIIDQYALKDTRIIPIHKKNGGVSSARTEGINRASGEWIGFVDGDDVIEERMYEVLINNAKKYNADISHCGYQMVFPDGHIDYYYNTKCIEIQDNIKALEELLSGRKIEPGLCNKLFKKSLFNDSIDYESLSKIKINEDLLLNYYLFKNSNLAIYEDFCPYHYILRKGSAAVSKNIHHCIDPLFVITYIKEELSNNLELYPTVYSRYLYQLINTSTQKEFDLEKKKALKLLRNEIKNRNINICKSTKLKLMVIAVAYTLPLYKVVRKMYDMVTGVSKKYDLH